MPEIFGIPHFHFDPEWWKTESGYARDALDILRRAVKILEKYPHFKFTIDTFYAVRPALADEGLVEKLRGLAREGRVEFVGGTFVAPDENLPCGEALIRQFVLGKKKIRESFGTEPKTAWLIDEFGHTPQLPQILAKCGFRWLVFSRGPRWYERLPVDFRWRAPDGTEILAHWFSLSYVGFVALEPLKWARMLRYRKELETQLKWEDPPTGDYLFPMGGDFTAPREEWLEAIERWNSQNEIRFRLATPQEFFEKLEKKVSELPVHEGEFNPVFAGTYESREKIKKLCREAERLLLDTEILSSLAYAFGGEYPDLSQEWERLLFNNHHDLITGTGNDRVYRATVLRYGMCLKGAGEKMGSAMRYLASLANTRGKGKPLVVFNTLPWSRRAVVEVEGIYRVFRGKEEIPCQYSEGRTIFIADLPSLGYRVFHLLEGESRTFETALSVRGHVIENEYYRVEVGEHGITSVFDKQLKKELLAGIGNQLVVEEDVGNLWTLCRTGKVWRDEYPTEVKVTERGPVRATIEIRGPHHKLDRIQRISLYEGLKRVFFETLVNFRGRDARLRVEFPLRIRGKPLYEVPFAHVRRRDGIWPVQNWAGLKGKDFGVYLLNHGIPSYETKENVISLGLMRSVSVLSPNFALHFLRNLPDILRTWGRALAWFTEGYRYLEEYIMRHHYLMLREYSSAGPPVQLRGGVTIPDHIVPYFTSWREADCWERGVHRFQYALYSTSAGVEDVVRRGLEFISPPRHYMDVPHAGRFLKSKSLVVLRPSNVILVTLKLAEDGEDIIARLYECSGRQTGFNLTVAFPIREARKVSADESQEYEELAVRRNSVSGKLSPFEIVTLRLKLGG